MSDDQKNAGTFLGRCAEGTASPDDIHTYVDMWHDDTAGAGLPLHVFLGMDQDEYSLWMKDPNAIHGIIKSRQKLT